MKMIITSADEGKVIKCETYKIKKIEDDGHGGSRIIFIDDSEMYVLESADDLRVKKENEDSFMKAVGFATAFAIGFFIVFFLTGGCQ